MNVPEPVEGATIPVQEPVEKVNIPVQEPVVSKNVLSCTCDIIQQSSRSYSTKIDEENKAGTRRHSVGKNCKCGDVVYDEINISFKGNSPEFYDIDLSEFKQSFSAMRDEMTRTFDRFDRFFGL